MVLQSHSITCKVSLGREVFEKCSGRTWNENTLPWTAQRSASLCVDLYIPESFPSNGVTATNSNRNFVINLINEIRAKWK